MIHVLWGISSSGRASGWHSEGGRFESGMLHFFIANTFFCENIIASLFFERRNMKTAWKFYLAFFAIGLALLPWGGLVICAIVAIIAFLTYVPATTHVMVPGGNVDKTYPTEQACVCVEGGPHQHEHRHEIKCPDCNKGRTPATKWYQFVDCDKCNQTGVLFTCCCGAKVWSVKSYGSCAIATSTYGTAAHPDLDLLRAFRDTTLKRNPIGLVLVGYYWVIKRPLADFVSTRDGLKRLLLKRFIGPAVKLQQERRTGIRGAIDDTKTFGIFVSALAFVTVLYPAAILECRILRRVASTA